MHENEVARVVVDAAYQVHVRLGPGLLESVYELVLAHELRKRGMEVRTQVPIGIRYDDLVLDAAFRADMIVQQQVIVELKSVESMLPVHKKQVITYLRLSGLRLGLLINFGAPLIKNGIVRLVNGLT